MDEAEFNEEEGGFSEHHSLLCSATSDVLSLALFRIFFFNNYSCFPVNFLLPLLLFFLQSFSFLAFVFRTETSLPYKYLHL